MLAGRSPNPEPEGLIGSLYQPLARFMGCSVSQFGYLHEVASLARLPPAWLRRNLKIGRTW